MRLEINKEKLLPVLVALNGIIDKKQGLPILSNVLVCAKDNDVVFSATDMEVERNISVRIEIATSGSTAIPARKMLDICRALPDHSHVEIRIQGNKALVSSGKSKFTLAVIPGEQFPTLGTMVGDVEFKVSAFGLVELFKRTQFAMAYQDVRYYLNGLLVEFDKRVIRAIATDGHRLAVSELERGDGEEVKRQLIIPRKAVLEITKMLLGSNDELVVSVNNNYIKISRDKEQFASKLIDGRFPDYEKVIPKKHQATVLAKRLALRDGLSRASILSNEKFKGVRLNINKEGMRATAHNAEQEEAEELIEVNYEGAPLEIGFNVSYLIEALGVLEDEEVEMELTDSNSSCLIKGKGNNDNKYVVMPMRL